MDEGAARPSGGRAAAARSAARSAGDGVLALAGGVGTALLVALRFGTYAQEVTLTSWAVGSVALAVGGYAWQVHGFGVGVMVLGLYLAVIAVLNRRLAERGLGLGPACCEESLGVV